jgi:hypothetical protein
MGVMTIKQVTGQTKEPTMTTTTQTATTQTTPTATLLRRAIEQVRETNKALWLAECQRLKDSGYEEWVDEVRAEDERLEAAAADALEVEEVDPLVLPHLSSFDVFTDDEVAMNEESDRLLQEERDAVRFERY